MDFGAAIRPVEQSPGCPTGKSLLIYGIGVKSKISVNQKYICSRPTQISAHLSPSRPTQRGVGHRHNEGQVAVDADVAMDGRGKGLRRKRVVLAPVTASSP